MAKETHYGFEIEMFDDADMNERLLSAVRDMIEACPDGADAVTQADIDDIIDDIRKSVLLGDDA